jgi:hypothetical protein
MDKEGFKFDLVTQRFIKERWNSKLGQIVRQEIIDGIKNSTELRAILDGYVLEHPENTDPYAHPIYPKSEMEENTFWVLTQDDLRGINFYNEDFSYSPCLAKKSLSYSSLYNCNLSNSNLEMTDLSYARIDKCNLHSACLAMSGGFNVRLVNSDLTNVNLIQSFFGDCDFSGSNFESAYFEEVELNNNKVNYLTKFALNLRDTEKTRKMPESQKPDILRSIRQSYENAELWGNMDAFLNKEKLVHRQSILWPRFRESKSKENFLEWFSSLLSGVFSGYSTKPSRVIFVAIAITLFFSVLYLFFGTPNHDNLSCQAVLESLYFSFTTFATLGYGDISYGETHPYLRLLSTVEAWIGAITLSSFVVVLSRKVFR